MNGTGHDCLEIKADYLENLTSRFSSIRGSKSLLHFCLRRFDVTVVCYLPWFPFLSRKSFVIWVLFMLLHRKIWKSCLLNKTVIGRYTWLFWNKSCKIRHTMAFFAFHFLLILLVTLNKPCNLAGCFVSVFLSHWPHYVFGVRCVHLAVNPPVSFQNISHLQIYKFVILWTHYYRR